LGDYRPRFVGISVVTYHLGSEHEGGDEQTVTRRSPSGRETSLEALEKDKGGEGDGRVEFSAVKSVGDEVRKLDSRTRGGRRILRTSEEVSDETSA